MKILRKIFLIIGFVVIMILVYRSLFSYRLVAFSNYGAKKHKVYDIFFFPEFPLSIINPFKKERLRKKIEYYCKSGEYNKYFLEQFSDRGAHFEGYFSSFCRFIESDRYDLISIKEAEGNLHILLYTDYGATIVFLLDPRKDEIVGFY